MVTVVLPTSPVTTPVAGSTDPLAGLLLVHVPPPGDDVSAVVRPAHTLVVPVIGFGFGFTVTTAKAGLKHPVPGSV